MDYQGFSIQPSKCRNEDVRDGRGTVGVRLRAYLVGIIAVVGVCLIVAFSELIASRGGSIDAILLGATHMPPGAICVLIVVLLANALVRRISRRLGLSSSELAVIYFMLVSAALISSFGLMTQLLPNLIGINYFANPQDRLWSSLFYKHIPSWLVPWDPEDPERQWVSVRFYEGLRVGERVLWGLWIKPLAAWLVFAFLCLCDAGSVLVVAVSSPGIRDWMCLARDRVLEFIFRGLACEGADTALRGATTYRNFRPFFLGLILGEFTTGIIWALLSGLLGIASPAIPIS